MPTSCCARRALQRTEGAADFIEVGLGAKGANPPRIRLSTKASDLSLQGRDSVRIITDAGGDATDGAEVPLALLVCGLLTGLDAILV